MPLPITDKEKTRMLHQIFSLFVEHGINGISMDDVANYVNLSKATIYKYFNSKEDIVRNMVNEIITHFDTIQFTMDKGLDDVLKSMSTCYTKAVLATAFLSSKFLADLESKFPDIYADYITALESFQKRFCDFYKRASKEGYCKQISIEIFVEQVKRTLPAVISSTYLNKHNTTVSVVIKEQYRLILYQLLSEQYMTAAEQEKNYLFVNKLVEILKSYFLI